MDLYCLGENYSFAEDPEHERHLEGEDGVEQAPVEREAEQRDPAAVVPQVRHCVHTHAYNCQIKKFTNQDCLIRFRGITQSLSALVRAAGA